MNWYDYAAIGTALVIALVADYHAGRAFRVALLVYIPTDRWVRAFELRELFGGGVYPYLRQLVSDGMLERKTVDGDPHLRDGRPDFLYRRRALS